jgi:hypothetical protein
MASSKEAARFAIISVPFKAEYPEKSKRVVGTYSSIAGAREARVKLVESIPHPSGYIESEDFFWVAYGTGADSEVLLLIEPLEPEN